MENTIPANYATALLAKARGLRDWLLLLVVSVQWCIGVTVYAGYGLPPGTVLVTNRLTLDGQAVGTPLTAPMLYTNVIPANSGNFAVVFSPNAAGQFLVSTNGPASAGPLGIGVPVDTGVGTPAIQFNNVLNFSTIEFALPGTNQSYLSVCGFVEVPDLWNAPATYDLIVLASGLEVPPYSTEDWTLQLNCGQTNLIQIEDDALGNSVKYGARPFPANTWLYFTMVMDTTNLTEYGAVFNATDGSLITSYTNRMGLSKSYLAYWLFGNNEAGSQPDTSFYFSGLNWANTPLPSPPPPPPPYTAATNRLVGQWKFNGDLSDSSPNGNDGAEFGGFYGYVIGAEGVAGDALGITNGTISTYSTNPVSAISVSFWINTATAGMPIAFDEFTSWYAYVASDGTVQFDLCTSGGHLNASTSDNWLGAWHLYTATWDAAGDGALRIYKDGVLDTATPAAIFGSIVPSEANLTIASGSSGYAMSGCLQDVRVYGRALNASEVATLHALGADGDINLDSVDTGAPPTGGYVLTAGQLVQFWQSADLTTWVAVGPVTNRLVLSLSAAAGYFRAQAMAHLQWASSSLGRANGYVVSQSFEPAPDTVASTNFYAPGGQTNLYVPLLGIGTNWFSVTVKGGGIRDRISNHVAWKPAIFTITLGPF
jgi:hypothetical protein